MTALTFRVLGVPVPQGSMKGYIRGGHVALTSDNTKLRPWRDSVAWAALEAMRDAGLTLFEGPIAVEVTFYLPRPRSTPKRVTRPAKKPDINKLLRGCLDAMSLVVFRDDALVVTLSGAKWFASQSRTPGALVTVKEAVERGD
ncbi:MAG: RusA family crossover junction endodeoxyribonuclease [Chloroflexi bacterium]|nr:RusA family crossover junction endodeoxyribonuclease [Chloroflexota bacterium]